MSNEHRADATGTDGNVLAVIPKNAHEVVRVQTRTYRGTDLLDVRVWTITITTGEDGRPTRKGLTLRPETWRALVAAIADALPE